MGETAEAVALPERVSKQECDKFPFRSYQRTEAATDAARFPAEILPVPV
jgi:acetyl-CoA acetyltransferase